MDASQWEGSNWGRSHSSRRQRGRERGRQQALSTKGSSPTASHENSSVQVFPLVFLHYTKILKVSSLNGKKSNVLT